LAGLPFYRDVPSRLQFRTVVIRGHVEETFPNFEDVAARPILVDVRCIVGVERADNPRTRRGNAREPAHAASGPRAKPAAEVRAWPTKRARLTRSRDG
jgi:hypothetical protein